MPVKQVLLKSVLLISTGFYGLTARAQLYIGNAGNDLFISAGNAVVYDGFKITPTANTTLSITEISKSTTAVTGPNGASSINRVYTLSNAITFTGNVSIYYNDAELNGNTETLLKTAYRKPDLTWTTPVTGTADAVNNIVSDNFSAITFNKLTATNSGNVLPLLSTSFKAHRSPAAVELTWTLTESNLYDYFEIQAATGTGIYTTVNTVQPVYTSALQDYHYVHNDIHFNTRFYRLKLVLRSGYTYYSPVISLNNTGTPQIKVSTVAGGLKASFTGWQPRRIQLYDWQGRLLKTAVVHQPVWGTQGLQPGAYLLIAHDEQVNMVRKILIH